MSEHGPDERGPSEAVVEAVARALALYDDEHPWDALTPEWRQRHRDVARGVLAAARRAASSGAEER